MIAAKVNCLCGAVSVPQDGLFQSATGAVLCHCYQCRVSTGALAVVLTPLSSGPPLEVLGKLRAHHASRPRDTRYFCATCGCHCFVLDQSGRWYVLGGIFDHDVDSNQDTGALGSLDNQIKLHQNVDETLDCGLSSILAQMGGRSVPIWSKSAPKEEQEVPHHALAGDMDDLAAAALSKAKRSRREPSSEYMSATCACGGVDLRLKRANYSRDSASSARYIATDPRRYKTYMCACRSCRLATGVSLVPWTLIPPANVLNAHTLEPVTFGAAALDVAANEKLNLTHYRSSEEVYRSFCSGCGATVFYWNRERPDELDMTVGIMRSDDGSLALQWLDWIWGRCSFPEEATDKELCDAWMGSRERMDKL
jgi:hypothetical protein